VTDIVDFRATNPGLTCLAAVEAGSDIWSDMSLLDGNEAGEAHTVLNLFLAQPDPAPFLAGDIAGRVLRGVPSVLVGRESFVVVLNAGLLGIPKPALPDAGLPSAFVADANVDFRLADDAADDRTGRAGDLVPAVSGIDIRFTAELAEDLEFSSEALA